MALWCVTYYKKGKNVTAENCCIDSDQILFNDKDLQVAYTFVRYAPGVKSAIYNCLVLYFTVYCWL